MLLGNKVAGVYGAGAIGGAVASAFAREGASVYLASRTLLRAEEVAAQIRGQGGRAEAAKVDALAKQSVESFWQRLSAKQAV